MQSLSVQATPRVVFRCRIAASAYLCASSETIAQWRKPAAWGERKLPAGLLKQADDQTLAALQAIANAIDKAGWQAQAFNNWGVVAAPNFLGRSSIAQTVERFRAEGAWGVAPNLIPNFSLHAVSGTISQVLSMHGPNFGVGGGPNAAPEAFLLAPALLADEALPGLWLVLTGHENEWVPAPGRVVSAPPCRALALALVPDVGSEAGCRLSIVQDCSQGDHSSILPMLDLVSLCDSFSNATSFRKWRLSNVHWLELDVETGR